MIRRQNMGKSFQGSAAQRWKSSHDGAPQAVTVNWVWLVWTAAVRWLGAGWWRGGAHLLPTDQDLHRHHKSWFPGTVKLTMRHKSGAHPEKGLTKADKSLVMKREREHDDPSIGNRNPRRRDWLATSLEQFCFEKGTPIWLDVEL